jgi:glycosyltransferase involved in cell wall biosynthesis
MRFLYFYRVPLPDARADAIQIVNTCAAIARAGGDVGLHVETIRAPSPAECLAFYGLKQPGQEPGTEGTGRLDLLGLGRHWSWPFLDLKVRRIIESSRETPTCLFVREVRPYVTGLIRRATAAGLKVIFESHNVSSTLVREKQGRPDASSDLRRKAEARAALEEIIVKSAHGLICTQRATLEGLRPLIRPGLPVTVLGNGTQLPPPRPEIARDLDILYCGSLKPWKGVDTLVAAMRDLPARRLTLAGPMVAGDVKRVRDVAELSGVLGRITILPPVKPCEVWDLYARASAGVIPLPGRDYVEARDFTSPLKLFEMMAAGLPIIASRLPSLAEYVTEDREAVLVAPDDPRALAEGIRRVVEDDGFAESLAAAARARAAEFTWDNRGVKIMAFAEQLFL